MQLAFCFIIIAASTFTACATASFEDRANPIENISHAESRSGTEALEETVVEPEPGTGTPQIVPQSTWTIEVGLPIDFRPVQTIAIGEPAMMADDGCHGAGCNACGRLASMAGYSWEDPGYATYPAICATQGAVPFEFDPSLPIAIVWDGSSYGGNLSILGMARWMRPGDVMIVPTANGVGDHAAFVSPADSFEEIASVIDAISTPEPESYEIIAVTLEDGSTVEFSDVPVGSSLELSSPAVAISTGLTGSGIEFVEL